MESWDDAAAAKLFSGNVRWTSRWPNAAAGSA